jgi:hypothetical protein
MAFFVCEGGVGNAACQARAGFGNACKLDIYNYVLNSGNLSLAATFSLEDGTVLQSAPASNLIKSTSHSVSSASWEWAGNSSTTDCGVAATIMNGNTTVAGVKLQNPNSGDSVFQQLLCQGFQCASAVIEDDATYHVAFIVCDSGLTSAACKTRAGF